MVIMDARRRAKQIVSSYVKFAPRKTVQRQGGIFMMMSHTAATIMRVDIVTERVMLWRFALRMDAGRRDVISITERSFAAMTMKAGIAISPV